MPPEKSQPNPELERANNTVAGEIPVQKKDGLINEKQETMLRRMSPLDAREWLIANRTVAGEIPVQKKDGLINEKQETMLRGMSPLDAREWLKQNRIDAAKRETEREREEADKLLENL